MDPATPEQEAYNASAKVRCESQFSWKLVDEVWVLHTLDIRDSKLDQIEHWQLSFDWKFVNQPVAAAHFDRHAWNLPVGSQVVDLRLGDDKPMLIDQVGTSFEADLPPAFDNHQVGLGRRWLVIMNVVVVSVLLGAFLKRQRLRRGTSR